MTSVVFFYPFGHLGLAVYCLALAYFVLFVVSLSKFIRVKALVRLWNSHLLFHLGLLIFTLVRALAFGILSFFSFSTITDSDAYYPSYMVLFILPEILFLSIYMLLFCNWLEIFIFSHDQFMFTVEGFHTRWRWIFLIINAPLYILQVVFYILLYSGSPISQSNIVTSLTYIVALFSLILPIIGGLIFLYFSTLALSGFPFISTLAQSRVKRINLVLLCWSFGRVLRGILLLISFGKKWDSSLPENLLSAVIVGILCVVEVVPFSLSLDWSNISMLLTGINDEQQALLDASSLSPQVSIQSDRRISQAQKWFLEPSEVVLSDQVLADSGISSTRIATWRAQQVCVRRFQLHELGSQVAVDEIADTFALYSAVDHPNIVQFLGIYRLGLSLFVVNEYLPGGSLADYISNSTENIPQRVIIRIAKQICRAMSFLHSRKKPSAQGIVHGHLSSHNILLDANLNAKVGDIAVARLHSCTEFAQLHNMENGFTAPEVLQGQETTHASDIYSFGMIMWHLLYRQVPHAGKTIATIRRMSVESGNRLPLNPLPNHDPALLEIVEECWTDEPTQRPTFGMLYSRLDEMSSV